ncbi:MAG TPA: SusC/RagA family TonB-linked outer membrane protein [Chitinophagaceae bacterium]|nr:SusC/RagA family TonB-linked outer membrane protein [Chitinophagaceae bacterium]
MKRFLTLFTMLMLYSIIALAQNGEITGKIVDSKDGTPLPKVSIKIKGTNKGTSTNADGTFSVEAGKAVTLEISGVGYQSTTILASPGQAINVELNQEVKSLNEVVVTALGIKREKRSLGYATQTVGGEQMNKSGTGNPLSELSGKASGVTVINSAGDPGAGTYIRLRGVTSIIGNNQPLMVIDGVPVDNTINNYDPTNSGFQASGANGNLTGGSQPSNRGIDINPNDIESINLLKGPAATALYGIQATSGALVITTKKGSVIAGKRGATVSLNSSVTFDKVSNLPPLQSQFSQGSGGRYLPPESGASISWGAKIDTLAWDGATDYPFDKHGNIVGKSDPSAKIPVTPYDRYNFFQTGYTYNNNVALSGGNERGTYRMSIGNLYQTGIIPKSKYVKSTFSLSGTSKLSDKLSASGNITYTNSANDKVQQGSSLSSIMLGLVRTPVTFDNANGSSDPANDRSAYILPDGTQRDYRGGIGYDNPYWNINKNPFRSELDRVFGYGQINYNLFDWINFSWRVGGDIYSQGDKNAYDINSNQFSQGVIYLIDYFNRQFNSDFTINIKKSLTKDISASLLLGHNYFTLTQSNRFLQGNSFLAPDFYDISNVASFLSSETKLRKRTMAYYADLDLSYKRMLYLTLTGRREETSTLAAKNNTFFYPSVNLGWVFTELESLKNNNVLTYGKLRGSFAQVGKDGPEYSLTSPFTPTVIKDGFTTGIFFPFPGNQGAYQISSAITTLGNPDLRPENTFSYEGGFDIGFFNDRLSFNATAYYSKSKDVIFPISIPYSTGYAGKLLNAATITNKGIELTLNTTPVKTPALKWDVNFNWSTNANKVVSLAPGFDRFFVAGFGGGEAEIDAVAGQPYGVIYGNTTPHVVLTDLKSPLLITDDKSDPGYGQPVAFGAGPLMVVGNTNPKWIGSVITSLDYKGFALGAQLDVRHGGDVYNGTRGALINKGTAAQTANRGQPVTFPGLLGHLDANGNVVHFDTDGVTELPGAGAQNTVQTTYSQYYWQNIWNSFGAGQEMDVEDGSYTRLRQVSLSYELPGNILVKTPFAGLAVTLFANNVKLWTKYDGVDPETSLAGPANAQGLDYFNNPGTKSYGIRLSVGF